MRPETVSGDEGDHVVFEGEEVVKRVHRNRLSQMRLVDVACKTSVRILLLPSSGP